MSGFSRFPANEGPRRTGLHLSLSSKSRFSSPYLRSPVHVIPYRLSNVKCDVQVRHVLNLLSFLFVRKSLFGLPVPMGSSVAAVGILPLLPLLPAENTQLSATVAVRRRTAPAAEYIPSQGTEAVRRRTVPAAEYRRRRGWGRVRRQAVAAGAE